MTLEHINHSDLKNFAENRVNLPKDKAEPYRRQAKILRDRLKNHLEEHPDFALKKMMLSGSLAKGTALSTINDIDVAVYVDGADTSQDISELLEYLTEKLLQAIPNFKADQICKQKYSLKISYKGSGLDIDVVPIIYSGDDVNWKGDLISQDDGSHLMTSIPMHLAFLRDRKQRKHPNFAEIAQLIKWWVRECKKETKNFRFKSFMVELLLCHLWDQGKFDGSNYIDALVCFFDYIFNGKFGERIVFTDNYESADIIETGDCIQIFDPVNPENNVGAGYTPEDVSLILNASESAGDSIIEAKYCTTKSEAIECWRRIFGNSFGAKS